MFAKVMAAIKPLLTYCGSISKSLNRSRRLFPRCSSPGGSVPPRARGSAGEEVILLQRGPEP